VLVAVVEGGKYNWMMRYSNGDEGYRGASE
jgi:hypothetical protein